jgi:hypothetical protein
VLIRVLTGNIRPCFSRRPDKPSTALHHQLANRDHCHHKENGVDRGPAIIAPGCTQRSTTTAKREQRRFPTDRGRAPRLAKVAPACRLAVRERSTGCVRCMALPPIADRGRTWSERKLILTASMPCPCGWAHRSGSTWRESVTVQVSRPFDRVVVAHWSLSLKSRARVVAKIARG